MDVIDNAQPDQLKAASAKGAIRDLDAPRPGASNRLELNSGHGVFRDEAVRKAFIAGAEIDPGLQSLFLGTAKRSYSVLSSVEPFGYSDPSLFRYSPTKAKQLLDEAGWKVGSDGVREKDGQRLTVTFPVSTNQSVPAERSLFQQVQASEKAVGFDVRLQELDLSSWYAALAKNEYDVVSAPYTKVGADVLRILYDSASIEPAPSGYFANLAQLDDPQVDRLLQQAAQTADTAERGKLYEQAQRLILASGTVLPCTTSRTTSCTARRSTASARRPSRRRGSARRGSTADAVTGREARGASCARRPARRLVRLGTVGNPSRRRRDRRALGGRHDRVRRDPAHPG